MDTGPTRRAVLRLGSWALAAGFVVALAGCSGPFGDAEPDRWTATVTPAPLPTVDADATRIPPVGALAAFDPLELVITDVVRSERATVLGGEEVYTVGDDEFIAVENDAEPSAPLVVGLGRFGGMSLADTERTEFAEDRWFDGTLAGGAYYDDATAIPPGEINEGTMVIVVPVDAAPLYLLWTSPTVLWRAGSGVSVNRYARRLR